MTKPVGASIAAVVILTATVLLIVLFGFIPLPEVPSLSERPDPAIPGTVAYVDHTGREEACIYRVDASGGDPTKVYCEPSRFFDSALSWTSEGNIVFQSFEGFGPETVVIDSETGTELARVPASPEDELDEPRMGFEMAFDRIERADGALLATNSDFRGGASVAVSLDGTRRILWEVEDAPQDYQFQNAQWSPDGNWILVSDSAGRLIILAAEGPANPRLLVERNEDGYSVPGWYIPGNDTYTVEG